MCLFILKKVHNYEKAYKKYYLNARMCLEEFSYKERSRIIYIPNFTLTKGDKISVMGESGQGKTTILNILSQLH